MRLNWCSLMVAMLALVAEPASSQTITLQDIAERIAEISEDYSAGRITVEEYTAEMDRVMAFNRALSEAAAAQGILSHEAEIPAAGLFWLGAEDLPRVTAGAALSFAGAPADAATASLRHPDGSTTEIDLLVEEGRAGEATILVPMPEGGWTEGGVYTVEIAGLDQFRPLRYELVPVEPQRGAVALLVEMYAGAVVQTLEARGVDPEALLAAYRADPRSVDVALAPAALALMIYADAEGDPVIGFLRSGDVRDGIGANDAELAALQEVVDAFATAVLHDTLTEHAMGRPRPAVLQRIQFNPARPVEINGLEDLLRGLRDADEIRSSRDVVIKNTKDGLKLLEWTAGWHPSADAYIAFTGAYVSLVDQALKAHQHGYPSRISVSGAPAPAGTLKADDSRAMYLRAEITAESDPYMAFFAQDGIDSSMALITVLTQTGRFVVERTKFGRAAKAADVVMSKRTAFVKEILEQIEKSGSDGTIASVEIPGHVWGPFEINRDNFEGYFQVLFRGDVRWSAGAFEAAACYAGSGAAQASLTTRADRFRNRYAGTAGQWAIAQPVVTLSVTPGFIRPGQTAELTAEVSGSEQSGVTFEAPSLGQLIATADASATYGAPMAPLSPEMNCRQPVTFSVSYPRDVGRICTGPAVATAGLVIGTGDGLIDAPELISCEPGGRVAFQVTHPDQPARCSLEGPGRLYSFGMTRHLYECPAELGLPPARITCTSNSGAPDQCSPVIPVSMPLPDHGVWIGVELPRNFTRMRPEPEEWDTVSYDLLGLTAEGCGLEQAVAAHPKLVAQAIGGGPFRLLGQEVMEALIGNTTAGGWEDCAPPVAVAPGEAIPAAAGDRPEMALRRLETAILSRHRIARPLGTARDTEVEDAVFYDVGDPGTTTYKTFDGSGRATVSFPDLNTFVVRAAATSEQTAGSSTQVFGASTEVQFGVLRRFEVTGPSELELRVSVSGTGELNLLAAPVLLLDGRYPISVAFGFGPLGVARFQGGAENEVAVMRLPGPPEGYERVEYAILFAGDASDVLEEHSDQRTTGSLAATFQVETRLTGLVPE